MRSKRPCRHPGCPSLTTDGWCDRHRPAPRQAERKASAAYHGWYSKPIWVKRLRPAQLMREPFCRECGKRGFRTPAVVVDHIVPFRGDWELFVSSGNHQSLCKYHHDQKTAREQAAERRKSEQSGA